MRRTDSYTVQASEMVRFVSSSLRKGATGDDLAARQLAEILDLAIWLMDPAACTLDRDRFCRLHRMGLS